MGERKKNGKEKRQKPGRPLKNWHRDATRWLEMRWPDLGVDVKHDGAPTPRQQGIRPNQDRDKRIG